VVVGFATSQDGKSVWRSGSKIKTASAIRRKILPQSSLLLVVWQVLPVVLVNANNNFTLHFLDRLFLQVKPETRSQSRVAFNDALPGALEQVHVQRFA
jgi:hypothetical protein